MLLLLHAGEYCAQGTQEETWLSLSTCRIAAPRDSAGAPATEQRGADSLASCHGFKPCPAGAFCPNASIARPCEPGRWCPLGSTASQSCNITVSWEGGACRAAALRPALLMLTHAACAVCNAEPAGVEPFQASAAATTVDAGGAGQRRPAADGQRLPRQRQHAAAAVRRWLLLPFTTAASHLPAWLLLPP